MSPTLAEFCQNLLEQTGPRFAGPIAILRNWTYCLFYVMAELWGSVVVSVLFWGFANQVGGVGCMTPLQAVDCSRHGNAAAFPATAVALITSNSLGASIS
jgi:hypothetical protein